MFSQDIIVNQWQETSTHLFCFWHLWMLELTSNALLSIAINSSSLRREDFYLLSGSINGWSFESEFCYTQVLFSAGTVELLLFWGRCLKGVYLEPAAWASVMVIWTWNGMLWVVKDFSFCFSKLTGFSIKSVHSASDNLAVCLKTSCSSFGWESQGLCVHLSPEFLAPLRFSSKHLETVTLALRGCSAITLSLLSSSRIMLNNKPRQMGSGNQIL